MASALPTIFLVVGLFAVYSLACHGGGQLPQRSTGRPGNATIEKYNALLKAADKNATLSTLLTKKDLAEGLKITPAELEKLYAYAQEIKNQNFIDVYDKVAASETELLMKMREYKARLEKDQEEALQMEPNREALAETLKVTVVELDAIAGLAESHEELKWFTTIYKAVVNNEKGK